MGFRVAGASALNVIGIAFISVLGLTSAGFARGMVWQDGVPPEFAPIHNIGAKSVPGDAGAGVANPQNLFLRNLETAEERFTFEQVYTPGIDLDPVPGFVAPSAILSLSEKELIERAVLRVAYAQYLVSLQMTKDVSPSISSVIEQGSALAPVTENMPVQVGVAEGEALSESALPEDVSPRNIEPQYLDIVAPVPRARIASLDVSSGLASSSGVVALGYFPVPAQSGLNNVASPIVAPVPSPASMRPVLEVRPVDVSGVRAMGGVSVDRLVHVDVPGSWPRRLDQINALRSARNLAENRDGQRLANADTHQRLANGMVLVGTNN